MSTARLIARCALPWFVPLTFIAIALSVFDIFPEDYHMGVGLVYVGMVFLGFVRCAYKVAACARTQGAAQAITDLHRRYHDHDTPQ